MTITGTQSFIARKLLGQKSNDEVIKAIGVAKSSYANWENGSGSMAPDTVAKAKTFFENRGIVFIGDTSADKPNALIRTFKGRDGFREFMTDVYNIARTEGGEIVLANARPSNWTKWLGKEWYEMHTARMQEALEEKDFFFKVTCETGNTNFIGGKHSEYRWVPDDLFNQKSTYVYGDRLALLNFEDDSMEIIVVYDRGFADGYRGYFNIAWDTVTTLPNTDDYKPESYD